MKFRYKEEIRNYVWDNMEEQKLIKFPRPVHGRIPNFFHCELACDQFESLPEFQNANVIKVHPSLNATRLRHLVIQYNKTLLVPPLPGNTFLYFSINNNNLPSFQYQKFAAEKRGFNKLF